MRITRLGLPRYGHLSDLTLDFPTDRGLHVVLGANEAGKSTALEAMADGLFGFGKASTFYQHPDDPRVVLGLLGADGHAATFERRKTGKIKLFDGHGTPVLERDLARFIGAMTRDRFRDMFGLTGERLRKGGDTILKEQGDAGLALLQDGSGLGGLREVMKRLDEAAAALFIGHGNAKKPINVAAKSVAELRRLMDQRALNGAEYSAAQDALATLERNLGETRLRLAKLQARQSQLERIRRTMKARGELTEAEQERATLGPQPPLPSDAAVQRASNHGTRAEAERDLIRDTQSLTALQAQRSAIVSDAAVLDAAELIDRLHGDLALVVSRREDRSVQQGSAQASLHDLDAAAALLGVPERGAALLARAPSLPARNAVTKLASKHGELAAERASAANILLNDQQALTECERVRDASVAPPDVGALRAAVDAVRAEGKIDRDLDDARLKKERADKTASRSLAALPLWTGTAAQLAGAKIPLDGEVLRLEALLNAAGRAVDEAQRAVDANTAAREKTHAALVGMEAAGPLPTEAAVSAVRTRRDAAWRLIRRRYIDGGAAASDAELEAAGLEPDLPAALDRLLADADSLADRRIAEVEQVNKAQSLRSDAAGLAERHRALSATLLAAQNDQTEALTVWHAAWSQSGVAPLLPAAMRDWIKARLDVLQDLEAAEAAQDRCDRLTQQRSSALDLLAAASGTAPDENATVAESLRLAVNQVAIADAAAQRAEKAQGDADAAALRVRKARQTMDEAEKKLVAWRGAWAAAMAPLGLTADVDIEQASDAIALWGTVDRHSRDWVGALDRVKDMDAAIENHDETRRSLAARLREVDSEALPAHLAGRLSTARAAQRESARLDKEITTLTAQIAAHETAKQAAERALHRLTDAAGAQDDAGLLDAIRRAERHEVLNARIAACIVALDRDGDGRTRTELDHEAAGVEPDSIMGELDQIKTDIHALQDALTELGAQRSATRAKIEAMEAGQDVAGPAQERQDHLVEIDENANRYIRLRLAHALLQGGVEKYRREQQGPLLTRAATVFTELTEGRYTALEAEIDHRGQPTIVATRSNSTQRRADELSEGARDQLFLALRLASIATEAQTTEPLPLIADDLLVNFDDSRARAALCVLADFGTQVILFTHHRHIADMIDPSTTSLHHLPA